MSASVLFDAPGPEGSRPPPAAGHHRPPRHRGFVAFALYKLGEKGNLEPEKWAPFLGSGQRHRPLWRRLPACPGCSTRCKAAAISVVLAGIFGVLFGMGRLSHNSGHPCVLRRRRRVLPVSASARHDDRALLLLRVQPASSTSTYVPLAAVVTGLTLYNGSVVAELIRSGRRQPAQGPVRGGPVHRAHPDQTLRSILLPQAITAMLPALVSQLVVVLKDTALGFDHHLSELLNQYKSIGSNWSNIVPAMIVIAAIFILINYALTRVAAYVERRLRERGRVTIGAGGGGRCRWSSPETWSCPGSRSAARTSTSTSREAGLPALSLGPATRSVAGGGRTRIPARSSVCAGAGLRGSRSSRATSPPTTDTATVTRAAWLQAVEALDALVLTGGGDDRHHGDPDGGAEVAGGVVGAAAQRPCPRDRRRPLRARARR